MPRMGFGAVRHDIGYRGVTFAALPFHIVRPGTDIQAAVTAAAADGRHIWIHPGTYTIAATITVPTGAAVYIWGCGEDTIIQCGAGVTQMFMIATNVTEFGLFDIALDGAGLLADAISVVAPNTLSLYLYNVSTVAGSYAAVTGRFIHQIGGAEIDFALLDYCRVQGSVDLRTAIRAFVRDCHLDAMDGSHLFNDAAQVYAARNHYDGGSATLGATVYVVGTAPGTEAIFHDEGSFYAGDVGLYVGADSFVSIRGCHIRGDLVRAVHLVGGSARIADCEISGDDYAVQEFSGRCGIHNCVLSIDAGGEYGVFVDNAGEVEVVGNRFLDCGVRIEAGSFANISANDIDATRSFTAIYIDGDECNVGKNNIYSSPDPAGHGIRLYGDDNVVTGNMLQGYTVFEDVGVTGNIIQSNRVGA